MIRLERERVGPWVRALRAAVMAAAPNDDFVPLSRVVAHLDALDPGLSGDLLLPAEVHLNSGMPGLAWMTRATAEQALARQAGMAPASATEAVRSRDPDLAARLDARARLHTHLLTTPLLDPLSVSAGLRRDTDRVEVFVVFDHIDTEGCWVRTRVELRGAAGQRTFGLADVGLDGSVQVADGVHDLFARHVRTVLASLHASLQDVTGGAVVRLSRGRVGPFWFPGGPAPAEAPGAVKRTLVLNLIHDVAGEGVLRSGDFDPLDPSPWHPPAGIHAQRHRRMAVFRTGIEAVREWAGVLSFEF